MQGAPNLDQPERTVLGAEPKFAEFDDDLEYRAGSRGNLQCKASYSVWKEWEATPQWLEVNVSRSLRKLW